MKLITGDKLTAAQRVEVLHVFLNRWTIENRARVTRTLGRDVPTSDPVSDDEWIRTHAFDFTKAGRLSRRSNYAYPAYMAD